MRKNVLKFKLSAVPVLDIQYVYTPCSKWTETRLYITPLSLFRTIKIEI